jgi:hypothetical protein
VFFYLLSIAKSSPIYINALRSLWSVIDIFLVGDDLLRNLDLFFLLQPDAYVCPQCRAPKKRFAQYDANTGKTVGGGLPPIGVIIGLVAGIGGVGALLVYGLQ